MRIRIRKADVRDSAGIAKVHIDTMRTTYQGIYPEDFLSNLSYNESQHRWETIYLAPKSQDTTYVAEDETESIVGFAICGPDRDNDPIYKGELIGLYVLQKMRRQGIGRQLLHAAAVDLKNRGFNSVIVWVLANNPAKQFYEKLGGRHIQTRTITVGGKRFTECGYGWKTLDSILH
jgi:ribosomal protein S18 acetylase RimI-like enzyme